MDCDWLFSSDQWEENASNPVIFPPAQVVALDEPGAEIDAGKDRGLPALSRNEGAGCGAHPHYHRCHD